MNLNEKITLRISEILKGSDLDPMKLSEGCFVHWNGVLNVYEDVFYDREHMGFIGLRRIGTIQDPALSLVFKVALILKLSQMP